MAILSRADFTTPQWSILQTAIIGSARYVSLQNNGLIDDWKESRTIKEVIKHTKDNNFYGFFRDLCNFDKYKSPIPKSCLDSADAIEAPVLSALRQSIELIKQKDPSKIDDFQNFILNLAFLVADSDSGITVQEQKAIDNIRLALAIN